MQQDYREHIGGWDEMVDRMVQEKLGIVKLQRLHYMAESGRCDRDLLRWNDEELAAAVQFFRAHTPLRHYVFRHTRNLLKRYRAEGRLDKNIPTRVVADRFIEFETATERELYDRIERYIREVYVAADEQNRGGVGFVMTIYRRRLTSSFAAIRCSLERRREHLLGEDGGEKAGLVQEDLEEEDLDRDVSEELERRGAAVALDVAEELRFIEEFLEDIDRGVGDTKFSHFIRDLAEAFQRHRTVVVFTQYTDTLDYLRDELRSIYGQQVACYSGRGGEHWDGERWVPATKEDIKTRFAEGNEIKLLLCTEAASEGLNLQTCSLLINYDMPWNPMKVEQRIGRIDRIGQEAEEVEVINYFYEDTVEARIHQRLGQRIKGFQWVVGPLQPILAQLPTLIRDAAFADPADRDRRVHEIVEHLERDYERMQHEALNLEEEARTTEPEPGVADTPPIRPDELERLVLGSELLDGADAFAVKGKGLYEYRSARDRLMVTFRPEVYDRFPDSATYLTYGSDAFDAMIGGVPEPGGSEPAPSVLRLQVEAGGEKLVAYHRVVDGSARPITLLGALDAVLDTPPAGANEDRGSLIAALEAQLQCRLKSRLDDEARRTRNYLEGRLAARSRDARHLLELLLSIDFARSHHELPADLEDEGELDLGPLLHRHLANRDSPLSALALVAGVESGRFMVQVRTLQQFVGKRPESLNASWGRLLSRAQRIVDDYWGLKAKIA